MPIPGTKFRPPVMRRQLVPRPRLLELATADNPLPRLVMIAAPAGFGKTTLLTQWLAELHGKHDEVFRVAWVSLDDGDGEVRQFLANLVEAVRRNVDGAGGEAAAMLDAGSTLHPEEILASLINDLDTVEGRTVLALDDYHLADAPAIHEATGFLIDHLPPSVTVAITTRADPPLPLARLRTRGELLEVRAADLRFTRSEAEEFLNRVMGLSLARDAVSALEVRTEGWAAGLQLAALSVRSHTDDPAAVDRFIDEFSGSHRFVLDYLVEEVLGNQSEQTRQFLIETSVLSQLTGDLCDRLTGRSDGGEMLEILDRANLFLVAQDEVRQWYRYHHLFAEALRARFRSQSPDTEKKLQAAASDWYLEHGMIADALVHATAGGDTQRTAELVELGIADLRRHRRDQTIVDWIVLVPDEDIGTRPILATAKAWSRLIDGDLDGVERWLDAAEVALENPRPTPDARSGTAVTTTTEIAVARESELRSVPMTISVYRASVAQARGDTEGTIAHAQRALEQTTPDDHLARGAAAGFLGLAAWANGDLPTAVSTFSEAVAQLRAAGNSADALGATVVLATMSLAQGRPDEAGLLYERALDTAERHPDHAVSILGDLHVGMADVLREKGDLDEASRHLVTAKELGTGASLPENRYRWYTAMADLCIAAGRFDEASEMLDTAERLYVPGFFPDVRPIAAARARAWILAGQPAKARAWAAASGPRPTTVAYLDEYNQLTVVRLLIAEGRRANDPAGLSEALGILDRIIESAEPNRMGSVIEARMLRALTLHATGDLERSRAELALAIEAGTATGYCRLFLDEGEPMTALLHALSGHDALSSPAENPASRAARQLLASATPRTAPANALLAADALSERELDVLRLLPSDLTGPEIARQLYISVNTLRTHTKRIFTKLGVNTRRAAVTQARAQGLL